MQKVLKFFERYCQWFAIGLGAIYLGFMVWTYFFAPTPPLGVSIGGKVALPGQINETIDRSATQLEDEMNKNGAFKIEPPPVLLAWQKQNSLADLSDRPIQSPFYFSGQSGLLARSSDQGPGQNQKVTLLPTVPAATPVAVVFVRTGIAPQGNNGQPPAANAAATDVDVVSTLFTIDHNQLAAAFNKVFGSLTNLPPNIQQQINSTMVLSVDLIREEQVNGSWGNQTVIAPLSIHNILALPQQKDPNADVAQTFVVWAETHTDDILRPSYYDTAKGMPVIYSPDQPPPPTSVDQPGPAPTIPPNVPQNPYLPRNRNNPNQPGNNLPGTPRRPHGSQGSLLSPSARASIMEAQYIPPYARPPFYGGNGGPGMPGGPNTGGNFQAPGQAAAGIDPNTAQGKVDVTKLNADIRIIGHDDTVVPGHTYRYLVRYTMYNSIFGIGNFAQPPALATQFYVVSPVSVASGPITIPTRLRFFLASVFNNKVVFDVFTWKSGHWNNSRSKEISPGDAIPNTDWSVLDVRDDLHGNGERYALLINMDGTVERHEVKSDSENPDFEQLEDDSKAAQADAANR